MGLKIAFLGIGLMGRPMVKNLLQHGYSMVLWNRTHSKAKEFEGQAEVAETPADAVKGADVIITMLETGEVVDDIVSGQGVLDKVRSGALFIDMSSISPEMARRHARLFQEKNVGYLDAPVS